MRTAGLVMKLSLRRSAKDSESRAARRCVAGSATRRGLPSKNLDLELRLARQQPGEGDINLTAKQIVDSVE